MSAGLYAVLLFPGTSHAVRAEQVLLRAGVPCKMIPVPRHISSDCGVCVRVTRDALEAAQQALRAAGAEPDTVCEM